MSLGLPQKEKDFNRIHFIGIGGSGMNGIARIMLSLGYAVSGSDLKETRITQDLIALGASVVIGHDAASVAGVDMVVRSTAVGDDNEEFVAAQAAGITVLRRAELLADISRYYRTIAVAGSHGKTMTSSLVAHLLLQAGLDPTYVIGGCSMNTMGYARLGQKEWFVLEADESDASFLSYTPTVAVVTNLDNDHLGTYQGDMACLKKHFLGFLHRLPFYGTAILCADDANLRALLPLVSRETVTYGFDASAQVRLLDYAQRGLTARFHLLWPAVSAEPIPFVLPCGGRHHALNAVAAMLASHHAGASLDAVRAALPEFEGVARRFQCYQADWRGKTCFVVDDYGHHPNEIKATLETLRAMCPGRRVVMLFEPHRYTRTQQLFDAFVTVLSEVDLLYILDIYPASEQPIPGVTSHALVSSVRCVHRQVHKLAYDAAESVVFEALESDDVLVFQGAGSIGDFALSMRQVFDVCQPVRAALSDYVAAPIEDKE